MSFSSIGEVLSAKNPDQPDDLMGFFLTVRAVVKKHAGVELETVNYREGKVGVSVASSIEASEIRLRHIQIERDLAKRSGRIIKRIVIRVA